MARGSKTRTRRTAGAGSGNSRRSNLLNTKSLSANGGKRQGSKEPTNPEVQQQLKQYEEAVRYFHEQKYQKSKQILEKVVAGPGRELADRGRVHLRIIEQRMAREQTPNPRSTEDHYQQGVAMMNLGQWDEAREHLMRARKLAPKADYVFYAMAALDCLTGEAESAMENLKIAIELRPENRYHARNDEDFAFLQEDPRFTELLYPEREGSGG